jgi:hypothetical protein
MTHWNWRILLMDGRRLIGLLIVFAVSFFSFAFYFLLKKGHVGAAFQEARYIRFRGSNRFFESLPYTVGG